MELVLIGGLDLRGDNVYVTVHLLQNTLTGAETQSNSIGVQVLTIFKLSKGLEQIFNVFLRYAYAFILHSYEYLLVLLLKPTLNAYEAFTSELVGVGEKVKQDLLEAVVVRVDELG